MKKIGLALGGGAVLGAAHIGVLRVLEEMGVEISFITGTSIGAFVGALYAFGNTSKEIEEIALDLNWMDISGIAIFESGLLSNAKLGKLLEKSLGEKKIEDAEIPFSAIATDISNGEKVVLDKGSVAKAVMASTCIPGVFSPVEFDDKLIVDGGIVENIPIDTVKKMGADYVIGVDLNARRTFNKPDSILDVMINSFHFTLKTAAKYQTQNADLLITPDLSEFNMVSTDHIKELIEQGYKDAKEQFEKADLPIR
ncbi:MAG: patatin-like phospholipase family protein [Prolixibacteraceae bacterium]|nr:patatin-like phospholipase family protein [Prolixibacteraceae bacterium]